MDEPNPAPLRRAVLLVALLNLAYFGVEFGLAHRFASVSLFADSIDFLEDTALNVLILVCLGLSLRARANLGTLMSGILLVPSAFAAWSAFQKILHPLPPVATGLSAVALGALAVNLLCAGLLVRFKSHSGSLTKAAFLSARNDAFANLAMIAAGLITLAWNSPWPDLAVGLGILALNADAAVKVFKASHAERKQLTPTP